LALAEPPARDQHPVGRLVDEREGRGVLEAHALAQRVDVGGGDRGQLRVDALAVLADHVDRVALLEPRIDHHRLPWIRGFGTDGRPLRVQMSRWLSEAKRIRTRTSPGPGTGSGTSS